MNQANIKIQPAKIFVKTIVMLVITLQVIKRPVLFVQTVVCRIPVGRATTRQDQRVMAVVLVIHNRVLEAVVLVLLVAQVNTKNKFAKTAALVNSKIKSTKVAVNPIVMPVLPSTMLERPVPNALTNTKIKQMKSGARIVPLVLP